MRSLRPSALDLSLRTRIAASISAVLGGLALLLVVWLPARLDAVAQDWSERRAIGLSVAVAQSLKVALEFQDRSVSEDRLALMSEFPDARYAALVGADGTVIGAWGPYAPVGRREDVPLEPEAGIEGELLVVRVPLEALGGTRGVMVSAFDQSALAAWRADNQAWIGWGLAAVWIAGLGVSFGVGTVLVRPLAELTARAKRLGATDDALHGDDAYRRDESRMLADAFGRMAERITSQMGALERERARAVGAEEQANEASRSKSRFLANMSHELRTPLNAILGYCQLVLENLELDGAVEPEDLRTDVGRIEQSGRHLLALINDVLDLAKIESGKLEVELQPVLVRPLLEDAATELVPLVHRNANTFELQIAPDVGRAIADPLRLRQCVTNLLSNAAKFTRNGRIVLRARRAEGWVVVEVEDTGIGIPQDVLGKLFQAFVQADASTTRRFGGTGLGLSLSRLLAERMGGDLSVTSAVGVGSTFRLRVPEAEGLARAEPGPAGEHAPS